MKLQTTLRTLMERHGLNSSAVAEKSGLSNAVVSRVANGVDYMSSKALGQLATAFPGRADRLRLWESWISDKGDEGGFTHKDTIEALGAQSDIKIPTVIREELKTLLDAAEGEDDPFFEVIHALSAWADLKTGLAAGAKHRVESGDFDPFKIPPQGPEEEAAVELHHAVKKAAKHSIAAGYPQVAEDDTQPPELPPAKAGVTYKKKPKVSKPTQQKS